MDIYEADEKNLPIVKNCCFGFMTQFDNGDIKVATENVKVRGPAEAEFVKKVLNVWGKALDDYYTNHRGA